MKTMKNMICVAVLSLCTLLTVTAQTTKIDVNGIIIEDCHYTKAQVIEKLGNPIKYSSWPGDFEGIGEEYKYTNSVFHFYDNGIFTGFTIRDPQFKLFEGRIKVGDPIVGLSLLPNFRFVKKSAYWPNNPDISDLYVGFDTPILITHKNGLITEITYTTPL